MRAFRLAYDGRPFYGFQRQPDVPTVEGALFDALVDLDVIESADEPPPGYAAAGRTDAGVSAAAQTVAFECPDWCAPRALNGALPEAVWAWASADVEADFHATHDAIRREYVYYLWAPAADIDRASAAAARLSGCHDFHNLTPDDCGTVRDLEVAVEDDRDFLVLSVASDGFSRHLVRRLTTLVESVATGASPHERVDRVLSAAPVIGGDAVSTAPAAGLVLTAVDYPNARFTLDPAAGSVARKALADRRRAAETAARTTERIGHHLEEPN